MDKQIIVRVTGGLGNQMFQYALGYALSKRYPDRTVKLDTTWYRQMHVHNGFELYRIFNFKGHELALKEASDKEIRKAARSPLAPAMRDGFIRKKLEPVRAKLEWHLQSLFRKNGKTTVLDENICKRQGIAPEQIATQLKELSEQTRYVRGYWQDISYIREALTDIQKEFQFPKLDEKNQEIKDTIEQVNSVSVHIRRGDYVGSKFDVLSADYYKRAIEYAGSVLEKPIFYFFSDDTEYVRNEFSWLDNKVIVQGNKGDDSYKDMQLMSACKINILANSSFSKWAGLLNTNEERKIIYPKQYHLEYEQRHIDEKEWVCL